MSTTNQSPDTPLQSDAPSLEKIPDAAKRMALSVCGLYREVKAGRLNIIKIGVRASAVSSQEVNRWIADRIAAAKRGAD